MLLTGQRNPLSHMWKRCGKASTTVKSIGLPEVAFSCRLFPLVIVVMKSEIQAWLKEKFSIRSRMFAFK